MVVLADLLAVPGLELGPVAVTEPDVAVRWVATSELVDPTPYLQGGEVLLTTGLETARWRTKWREYVGRLVAADVGALGLGVGLTHQRAPLALVEACRGAGLNLFEVPRPTAFVAISRAAATLLDEESDRTARRSLDAQRELTRAALEDDDVTALLDVLARQVGGAAATVTRDGELLTRSGDELDSSVVRSEVVRIRSRGLRAAASSAGEWGTTIVQPLGVRSGPELWLAVFVPGRPSEVHRVAVSTAVSLLGLSLERRQDRRATDRHLRVRAIELLLAGDARTARFLLDASPPRRVRVLCARGSADLLDDALAVLERETVLAGVLAEELTVLCPPRRASWLATQLADGGLLVGIGRRCPCSMSPRAGRRHQQALGGATPAAPIRRWEDQTRAVWPACSTPVGPAPSLAPTSRPWARTRCCWPRSVRSFSGTVRCWRQPRISPCITTPSRNRINQLVAAGRLLRRPQARADAWVALQSIDSAVARRASPRTQPGPP